MSQSEPNETAGGALGQVVGKAKAAIGSLLGHDDLQREGNLQQAQADAERQAQRDREAAEQRHQEVAVEEQRTEAVAERERLRTELESEQRREAIEQREGQLDAEIATQAGRKRSSIEAGEMAQQRAADAAERAAVQRHAVDTAEAARLEQKATRAEAMADAIDPETK